MAQNRSQGKAEFFRIEVQKSNAGGRSSLTAKATAFNAKMIEHGDPEGRGQPANLEKVRGNGS